jgi:hypothetical protein
MKRSFALLLALLAAGAALVAAQPAAADGSEVVVVDPQDFRPPIPDPEQGLTQKYDHKQVRFTGTVTAMSQAKASKAVHYTLTYEIVHRVPGAKGKPATVVGKDIINVAVTFARPEKQLQKQVEGLFRLKKPGPTLTVEGKGAVMTDGALHITEAVIDTGKKPFGR